MNSNAGTIRKTLLICLLLLLFFMPFSTFVWQAIRQFLAVNGYPLGSLAVKATVGWKEILLLIMGFLFVVIWVWERQFPFALTRVDAYLLSFMAIGILLGGYLAGRMGWVIFGFRYDFSPFMYYFAARAVILSRQQVLGIMKIMLYLSIPIFLFAFLQTFYLPRDFLERFGYSWGMTVTGNPLPPYHLVAGNLTRAMATFPGPNSLAMYSVIIFFLSVLLGKYLLPKTLQLLLPVLSLTVLVITFSRGHLISLLMAVLLGLVFYSLRRYPLRGIITGSITIFLLIVSFLAIIYVGNLRVAENQTGFLSYLLHQESTEIHRNARLQAWEIISQHPLGSGLGSSGLATTNTGGQVFNPESWYVQITQELGWLGLLMGLALLELMYLQFAYLEKDLFDEKDRRLFHFFLLEFSAIAVSANFLPSWFEVSSLIWWILFGFFVTDYLKTFPRAPILLFGSSKRLSS